MKLSFAAVLMLLFFSARAQTSSVGDLASGYYVVVASYKSNQESYAQAYSTRLNAEGKHTAFGFDPGRKFFHVYLDRYSDFKESIREMLKARQAGHPTAWVRIMISTAPTAGTPPVTEVKETPAVSEAKVPAPAAPKVTTPATETAIAPAEPKTAVEINPAPADAVTTAPPPAEAVPAVAANDPILHPKMMTENTVIMTLFNPTNNEQIEGDVEIVDADRSKLLTRVKSNEPVMLPDPKNSTGKLSLKASAFGYRPAEHSLNYKASEKDSLPDFVDINDNHYRLRFEMVRLRRGDIAVLYNVYFYNDAAVMIPDSKYELNKLLELMNANKKYRIKLHGHTNGNAHGKIVSLGPSKNFFSLNADVKQGFGSAKELSRQRAETIKAWLVANNIAADRIEVQAHGGSRMIHDKNGANARRNVRVEVEMLSE